MVTHAALFQHSLPPALGFLASIISGLCLHCAKPCDYRMPKQLGAPLTRKWRLKVTRTSSNSASHVSMQCCYVGLSLLFLWVFPACGESQAMRGALCSLKRLSVIWRSLFHSRHLGHPVHVEFALSCRSWLTLPPVGTSSLLTSKKKC